MRSYLLLIVLFLVNLPFQVDAQSLTPQSYENGLVVSAEERASMVGRDILRQGGNAVDAAVAVQFALAVTLPRAGNIGGGGFMVIRLANGEVNTLDFREVAPRRANRNMYIRNGEFQPELSWEGALAVGVPGTVDGMIKALERYGRLPLDVVIQPAIELARNGYALSYTQAMELNSYAGTFKKFESSARYFTKEDQSEYQEGDIFIQRDLAETLSLISRFGREGFYSGQVADAIVSEMRKLNGLITYRDLRDYESKWRAPVKTQFMGYTLHIMPPPSSGSIAVAQILSMIDDYPLAGLGHNSSDYIHLITEAMRRAFADRAYYLGDPDFWNVPESDLLSNRYNERRFANFSMDRATSSYEIEHGEIPRFNESSQTTHFSVVDTDGNAVAVTTTLNGSFGSKVAVGRAGFLLNNEMDDFSAQPGVANAYGLIGGEANSIQPRKRMLSSMTPAIVSKDGKLRMVIGAAGGPRIITGTLQTFLNGAVFGMNAQEAISAPRFHHQWFPDQIYLEEYGFNKDTYNLLTSKGHKITTRPTVGRGHIIFVDPDGIKSAGVDPRGDGAASGY
ncbi:gamma-glutamyltransferase [Balneola sp. MJW-20]|uniref:gamma-glutamyltransferase n=1 Tax=Gracilimonas aurantiaca TaxID=3234185 RepID=UPI0034670258